MRGSSELLSFLRSVLSWLVIIVVLAFVAVTVVVPRLADARPYTILTSSMEPGYPPGSLVVVRRTPVERIGIGDVITYQLRPGRPEVVTHRVISTSYGADGSLTFRTQGDANPSPDAHPVVAGQVRGTLWYALPWLGYVNRWLAGGLRVIIVAVVVAGLVGYAVIMFVSAGRDRRAAAGVGT